MRLRLPSRESSPKIIFPSIASCEIKPSETKIVSATDVGKAYEAAKQEHREVEKDNAAIMMYEGQGIFMSRQNRVMFGASPAEAAGQSCNGFKREGECVIC